MIINSKLPLARLNLDFDYEIVFHSYYRNYFRTILNTKIKTIFGYLKIMILERYDTFRIYMKFENGVWFKYHKQYRRVSGLVNKLNYIGFIFYLIMQQRLIDLRQEYLNPLAFFHTLDYFIVTSKLSNLQIKRIMIFVDDNYKPNKLFVLECLGHLFNYDERITIGLERSFQLLIKSVVEFPDVETHQQVNDLMNYKYPTTYLINQKYIPNLSYEEFCETLEGLTKNEIIEMIGYHKIMNELDYTKDPRKVLYYLVQKHQNPYKSPKDNQNV